jgi:hypothetical protein
MIPMQCRADMKLGIHQIPGFKRTRIERRGRTFIIAPGKKLPRRVGVKFPAWQRAVVAPPAWRIGPAGPRCVAFLRPGADWRS